MYDLIFFKFLISYINYKHFFSMCSLKISPPSQYWFLGGPSVILATRLVMDLKQYMFVRALRP